MKIKNGNTFIKNYPTIPGFSNYPQLSPEIGRVGSASASKVTTWNNTGIDVGSLDGKFEQGELEGFP